MNAPLAADTLLIGSRPVGPGHPAYLVAEIGINHNGDLELARRTIDAAAASGADAVKFQNYATEDFLVDRRLPITYTSQGREVTEPQYDLFARCELSPDDLAGLADHCRAVGIDLHSTPTHPAGVQQLVDLGVGVLKNGSDYLTHLELIRCMGETGLPTVLSTGMATLGEIDDAVRAFRATGNDQLVLLHCVSRYPTPPADLHLRRIESLREAFGCPVGFSDHSDGPLAPALSVAFGACWIEKHFTLDRDLPGPDHRFSMDPPVLREVVRAVRDAEAAMGTARLAPTAHEAASRRSFRLSCAAAADRPAGHVLTRADVGFYRPGTGLPPKDVDRVVGRRLARAVRRGDLLDRTVLA